MRSLVLVLMVFFWADVAFAQCVVNGESFPDGTVNPNNPCLECDETNPSVWTPIDCSALDDVCTIGICVVNGTASSCQARQLPKFTRCSDVTCTDGVISQGECSGTEPATCDPIDKRTCDGFLCLNASECAVQCVDESDCLPGYSCNANICEPPTMPDAGPSDMGGSDLGVPDLGMVDSGSDVSSQDAGPEDMSVPDQNDPDMEAPAFATTGGCATATHPPVALLCIVAILLFGRRRKTHRNPA